MHEKGAAALESARQKMVMFLSSLNWRKTAAILSSVRESVDIATKIYIRTTPLIYFKFEGKPVTMDIKDMLILGTITESDVLLTGKTGSGKTRLASGVLEGLFGRGGYYAKTTLPNMNPSEFMDIDFPSLLSGKKPYVKHSQGSRRSPCPQFFSMK